MDNSVAAVSIFNWQTDVIEEQKSFSGRKSCSHEWFEPTMNIALLIPQCGGSRDVMPIIMNQITHWGWVTYIWVSKLTIIGSHNGLSPGQRQAIIWTNAGVLLINYT